MSTEKPQIIITNSNGQEQCSLPRKTQKTDTQNEKKRS